jgi:hypothetical protein
MQNGNLGRNEKISLSGQPICMEIPIFFLIIGSLIDSLLHSTQKAACHA